MSIKKERRKKVVNENWRNIYSKIDKEYGEDIGDLFYLLYKEIDKDNLRKERIISKEILDILRYFRNK